MRGSDESEIVDLLSNTLGWRDDERHRKLLAWKHDLNPFGASPRWVAEDEDGVVGFRALMRWEFEVDGSIERAVRAVDTGTHPRAQGRGIFRALTMRGVEEMTDEGVECVFNTPNPKSAPGYLSMGWEPMGRLPVSFRPARPSSVARLSSARAAGDLWSVPTSLGDGADDVLGDRRAVTELLASVEADGGSRTAFRTHRTAAFLEWRYGKCPVGYRALMAGRNAADGLLFFRLRRRGSATEAVIADSIMPGRRPARAAHSLLLEVLRSSGADYAVALGASRPARWLPLPRLGPLLTWRRLRRSGPAPSLSDWNLCTGDVELF